MRERTMPRTDSTHVLAAVRDLTRLKLVTEAIRAGLEVVARTASHLLTGLVDEDWERRYGRPARLGKNYTRPKTRILTAGDDACRLLERRHRHGPGSRPGPQAEALRRIVVSPTTPRRAMPVTGTSSVGRGSPRMSPRHVPPTAPT
ncbi:hypothetical protein [Streptomyces sanglieri]|uniref:hypothetical protein n=1 Tax=Streptomyces sanglieri TaxID=193460 RepID=UPI003523C7DD